MTDVTIPVFDWATNPWLAVVQLLLVVVLPILVGLLTDNLTQSWIKVTLLGLLSFLATVLTAVVVGLTGGDPDWPNIIGNGLVTWVLGIVAYLGVLKNLKTVQKVQGSTAIQIFEPAPGTTPPSTPSGGSGGSGGTVG